MIQQVPGGKEPTALQFAGYGTWFIFMHVVDFVDHDDLEGVVVDDREPKVLQSNVVDWLLNDSA
jgi:hypothetical protein